MALLGDDGRGYDLARQLESCGVWRAWLGDSTYASFKDFLSSPSDWESFMRVDDSKSRAQIQLQLRARALLFDKATVALFLRSNSTKSSNSSSPSVAVSKLNPNYLQLHGDDVYFTLEGSLQDGGAASYTAPSKVSSRSPVMIERLGIRPEYLNMEQGGNVHRGKNNRKLLGQEQASQMSRKVIARLLTGVGFEGATEAPVEVFSQFLSCHISKLGRNLKVLTDNYRKQCSAIELIRMFLQTSGYSNFGTLAELVKDSTRNLVQQTQQQMHGIQSQLQPQHQNALRMAQQLQMTRQMHPQMQQMVHPQNLTFQQQQQLERMRRHQQSTPHHVMETDKDRPMVQVKIENPSELPMESNVFTPINTRHPQMHYRQRQLAAMSNMHAQAQSSNQFRQLMSPQIPQMQTQNMSVVRAPPVKVEGFQELMGGDTTLKHDSEENKLTSPSNK
ncbi:uncharacterized protein LOC111317008 isoform X3 [Durio zibethinus]|uniref:Uncharacterized protein LOC111317008 isoform X3 n=1 Tax=Durio zibethinus TaxID=66656 RepID=A0A6P6BD37_DURZI|nr:uncharacterized protein LOC111317008 isoform X3 [Durio zibethinus]